MKLNCTYPGKPGAPSLKIHAIFLFWNIFLFSGQQNTLYAQNDSLEITAVPLREVANEAASDRQATRDILIEKVQVSSRRSEVSPEKARSQSLFPRHQ